MRGQERVVFLYEKSFFRILPEFTYLNDRIAILSISKSMLLKFDKHAIKFTTDVIYSTKLNHKKQSIILHSITITATEDQRYIYVTSKLSDDCEIPSGNTCIENQTSCTFVLLHHTAPSTLEAKPQLHSSRSRSPTPLHHRHLVQTEVTIIFSPSHSLSLSVSVTSKLRVSPSRCSSFLPFASPPTCICRPLSPTRRAHYAESIGDATKKQENGKKLKRPCQKARARHIHT